MGFHQKWFAEIYGIIVRVVIKQLIRNVKFLAEYWAEDEQVAR